MSDSPAEPQPRSDSSADTAPLPGRVLRDAAGTPITYPLDDTDLIDRMARNTSYMIHPQEVIADNFALLMEWRATGVQPGGVPGGPGEGFPVNDVALRQAIERALTHGCPAAHEETAEPVATAARGDRARSIAVG